MMRASAELARQVQLLRMPMGRAEPVQVVAQCLFDRHGALVGVQAVMPPPTMATAEEAQAVRLVQSVGERLARRRDVGVAALRREAERLLAALEQLEAAEASHAAAARALLGAGGA